jgi:hypothetical protein
VHLNWSTACKVALHSLKHKEESCLVNRTSKDREQGVFPMSTPQELTRLFSAEEEDDCPGVNAFGDSSLEECDCQRAEAGTNEQQHNLPSTTSTTTCPQRRSNASTSANDKSISQEAPYEDSNMQQMWSLLVGRCGHIKHSSSVSRIH